MADARPAATPVSADAENAPALGELLAEMTRARHWSTRLFNLQRQGRIGTTAPIDGEEAAVVGSAAAMDPAVDWAVPQYREPVGLGRFGEAVLRHTILYHSGHPDAGRYPAGVHVFPTQISIAAQIPHAVGLAWGMRLRRQPGVVLCYFGDGASSEGDFYEAANLAGVVRAPVILFCINNGWAISTPVRGQTAADSFAGKAAAAGIAGERVDGNDVVAVLEATAAARRRAAAGEGPTLIEAVTYRMGPHTTADDPTRYVPPDELELWRARDPIARLRRRLEEEGGWDDARQRALEEDADRRFDAALAAADATPLRTDCFIDSAYAQPTPELERQRRILGDAEAR
ncbi:MAG TPA: thiamine pyrophosphate-dependent enzyme [Candidatus Dormibacteraeota bacterium]|nr:thiamine pyrophosphate-dependent enzyme [Candidatus Dormibacteraeota bacterium]